MLVAIDGPAGAGKSTVARALAHELGFTYLDSGAMYRCVALGSTRDQTRTPAEIARGARIEFPRASGSVGGPRTATRVLLDGEDVSEAIRAPAVSETASQIASDPGVRAAMVSAQRKLIAVGDWVAEGRDIGTVVAPEAALKVFLTASPQERARRRAAELGADPDTVLAEQALRDGRDSAREHSPLQAATDAVTLDTTGLTLEQVVARIVSLAR